MSKSLICAFGGGKTRSDVKTDAAATKKTPNYKMPNYKKPNYKFPIYKFPNYKALDENRQDKISFKLKMTI
jgi:hypothetical protein